MVSYFRYQPLVNGSLLAAIGFTCIRLKASKTVAAVSPKSSAGSVIATESKPDLTFQLKREEALSPDSAVTEFCSHRLLIPKSPGPSGAGITLPGSVSASSSTSSLPPSDSPVASTIALLLYRTASPEETGVSVPRNVERASNTRLGVTVISLGNPFSLWNENWIPCGSVTPKLESAVCKPARSSWNIVAASPDACTANSCRFPLPSRTSTVIFVLAGTWVGAIAAKSKAFQNSASESPIASVITMSCTLARSVAVACAGSSTNALSPGCSAEFGRTRLSRSTLIAGVITSSWSLASFVAELPFAAVAVASTVLTNVSEDASPATASVVSMSKFAVVNEAALILLPSAENTISNPEILPLGEVGTSPDSNATASVSPSSKW